MREGVGLKSAALVVREWNGRIERVMREMKGEALEFRTSSSLCDPGGARSSEQDLRMPPPGCDRRARAPGAIPEDGREGSRLDGFATEGEAGRR